MIVWVSGSGAEWDDVRMMIPILDDHHHTVTPPVSCLQQLSATAHRLHQLLNAAQIVVVKKKPKYTLETFILKL